MKSEEHPREDSADLCRAVEALKASEEKYRTIYDDAPFGIFQSTVEGRLLSINPTGAALFAYDSPEEFIAAATDTPKQLFVRPEQRGSIIEEALQTDRFVRHEVEYRRRNGSTFTANLYMRAVRRGGGEVAYVEGFVEDITERRRAEEAVRHERDFSAALLDSLPGVQYLYDENFHFLRWNRNFERVLGYSGEEIARMSPLDFFSGADKELVGSRIREVFATGGSHVEAEFVARDGTRTPYYFTGQRTEIAGRTCLLGVGIDISGRKRAEKLLHESEQKYRELVENANSIILRWSRDGNITFINEFGQKFFGYSEDEILGRNVIGTIVPETETTGRDLVRMMEQIRANPKAFEQNVNENMRCNGERVWIAWANKPVLDEEGHVLEVFSVGTDITERRRAEKELARYRAHLEELVEERTTELQKSRLELLKLVGDLNEKRAELEAANEKLKEVDRLKSMFIASMSHELRTPLNSVIGYSSIILNEWLGPVDPQQKEKLAIVLRSGKHLLSLINDVIDVSKIEAGQIEIHFEEFDLFDLVAEAVQQLEAEIRGKGLAFAVDNCHRRLRSDRRRLLQATLNILSNAMKYTPAGSIRFSARCEGGRAEIAVTDTGIGISETDAAQLFQPFVRFESSIRSLVPGTGLGLYLTHKLVTEILRGEITFSSRVGVGSTFTIRVPAELP